ncbi:histidine kinase [Vallitaleaceae bacterium 9-2]
MIKRLKEQFNDLNLDKKVKYLFIVIIFMYLLVFYGIYAFIIQKSMIDYTVESNMNTLKSIGNNLNAEIESIDNMSQLIMTDKEVVAFLKAEEDDFYIQQEAVRAIYDTMNIFNHVSSVFVFQEDYDYVSSGIGVTYIDIDNFEELMKKVRPKAGGYHLAVNADGAVQRDIQWPVVSLVRTINDLETQKPIGTIMINLSIDMLDNTYRNMTSDNKSFCFFDIDGMALTKHNYHEALEQVEYTGEKYYQITLKNEGIVSYQLIEKTPFILKSFEKINFTQVLTKEAGKILALVFIVSAFAMVIIGLFITRYITHPIQRLAGAMKSVNTGWLRRVSLPLAHDEIGYLKDSYNDMLVEINKLIHELIEKEKSVQQAELDVLQEQIKPHFLYNTLDTIAYLALTQPSEQVYEAIDTLGKFYRKFLSRGSRAITIKDEVGIVKDYLTLQRLRYGDIFDDVYEVDAALENIRVPKLILQPLVENSLYHGVRLKGEKCIIKIQVFEENKNIHLVIFDSGVGMSTQRIAQIMEDSNQKSFGFKGTMERIQYFYNQKDVVEITSRVGEFTKVDIIIPKGGVQVDVSSDDY